MMLTSVLGLGDVLVGLNLLWLGTFPITVLLACALYACFKGMWSISLGTALPLLLGALDLVAGLSLLLTHLGIEVPFIHWLGIALLLKGLLSLSRIWP